MSSVAKEYTGGCLCGGVQYKIQGPLENVLACHCTQCRKTTGHFVAALHVKYLDFNITKEKTLSWFNSSPGYDRGFCNKCGSSLFWRDEEQDYICVFPGTIDGPTHVKIYGHIYTADKGDYYEINDDLPKYKGSRREHSNSN